MLPLFKRHRLRVTLKPIIGRMLRFHRITSFLAALLLSWQATYAGCWPEESNQLVYILAKQANVDADRLEKLMQQHYEEGLQIVLIVTDTLCGLDIAMYANRLGESWGVGHQGEDDGIVIVMLPPTNNRGGQLFVAPGRGIQGILPDAYVKRLVDATIKEYFSKEEYTEGLTALVQQIAEKAKKEQPHTAAETMTMEEFIGETTSSSSPGGPWRAMWKGLLWLFILAYSVVVWMYVTGHGGIARFFKGHHPQRVRESWQEVFFTALSWAALVALLSWSWQWGVAVLVITVIFSLIGYFLLHEKRRLLIALSKKTEIYLFPLALLTLALWTLVKLLPYAQPARRHPSDYESHSSSGDSHTSPQPTSGGSSGTSIEFGGGRFNGGGAGGSW